MPKSVISVGRFTYCHDDEKQYSCFVDVHDIHVETSCMKTLLISSSIILTLLTGCYLLTLKGISIFYPIWVLVGSLSIGSLKLKEIQKETIVIMPALGIQLETLYWSGRIRRRFVSIDKILKPILNECVTPMTCYWNLALILRGEKELMPVFQESRLPIRVLVPVWKALCSLVELEHS